MDQRNAILRQAIAIKGLTDEITAVRAQLDRIEAMLLAGKPNQITGESEPEAKPVANRKTAKEGK